MIRDEDVEAVKSAVNMVQLAQAYGFRVNRKGFMLCPFHGDKNPSMKVYSGYLTHDGFYCWSCAKHGDIIRFVREYEGLDFEQAVRRIAGMFGIPVSNGELTKEDRRRIDERRARLEAEAWREKDRVQVLADLAVQIRWLEKSAEVLPPMSEAWCGAQDLLAKTRGEWEDLFSMR